MVATYCAWQINKNRQVIETYMLSRKYQYVLAMIDTPITEESKKRKARKQVRWRKGSSRKGHRPHKYRTIRGAKIRKKASDHNLPRMLCMAAVAMSANNRRTGNTSRFDTDSKIIRVDNCASYCISNDLTDFVTELVPIKRKLKGSGGTVTDIQSGTIRWSIQDDLGVIHNIEIPEDRKSVV